MSACHSPTIFALLGSVLLVATMGCSGTARGTGEPAPAKNDKPTDSSQDGVTDSPPSKTDDQAPAAPSTTVTIDGQPATIDPPWASYIGDVLDTHIQFKSDAFGADLSIGVRHPGKGCAADNTSNWVAMSVFAAPTTDGSTLFTPNQSLPEGACGLVVTAMGARLVGSFQGDLDNGKTKHAVVVSFDIPITQ